MNVLPLDLESQSLKIAKGFWAFVATWVPLTAVTVGIYLALSRYHRRSGRARSGQWASKEAGSV